MHERCELRNFLRSRGVWAVSSSEAMLYVGTVWEGSTCLTRMRVLQRLGYNVHVFDVTPYLRRGNRFLRAAQHRLNRGPAVAAFNRDLCEFYTSMGKSMDYVWIDKGRWVAPDTLQHFKRTGQARLIHYTPDPQLDYHQSHLFNHSIPMYDVMFTTKPFEVERYRQLGANICLVNQSYDAEALYPRQLAEADQAQFCSDVTFIGRYEAHYDRTLRFLRANGVSLKLWGPGWEKRGAQRKGLIDCYQGAGLWGADYGKGLSGAKIGLCLLSKLIPETSTTRSFEIPGSGTFMLAERTAKHCELFEEGKEAEFFSSDEELSSKISYYLKNSEKRETIAKRGYQRCVESRYSNDCVLAKIMDVIRGCPERQPRAA